MSRSRLPVLIALSAAALISATTAFLVTSQASASVACATAWNSTSVYTSGMTVSRNGHNYQAKWWTQNEDPEVNGSGVWSEQGTCGGEGSSDPSVTATTSGFVVSEDQFERMFPARNTFYTYSGLVAALNSYPGFATTGSETVRLQEAAAFLANVSHETGGLVYVTEQNTANYSSYCDASQSYGCPAGQSAYYGRGPIQLSWNYNYRAAGEALGIDLLNTPSLVETDAAVSWSTALWYWMTQNGPGTMTAHEAMVSGAGFGQTIRSINGVLECDGGNVAQVQSRVSTYQDFTKILAVTAGDNLTC